MRCHPMNFLRRKFLRSTVLIIFILIVYVVHKFSPYVYEVAHGELPCFASESDRSKIRHMLFSFHELMFAANLTYWIDCGTLLGSVRRQGMIPYDHDADIAYLLKDMVKVGELIAPALKKKFNIDLDQMRPVSMAYEGKTVDLFVMGTYLEIQREIPDGKTAQTLTRAFYRVSENFEQTYADTEADDVFPTKLCPFENKWLMCPKNPGKILETRYPYTYPWNVKVPFKLRCYLNVFNLIRIMF